MTDPAPNIIVIAGPNGLEPDEIARLLGERSERDPDAEGLSER